MVPRAQIDIAAAVPDLDRQLAARARRGAAFARTADLARVEYGPHRRQWIEWVGGGAPTVLPVFVHGGYWRALTAEGHRAVLPGLLAHASAAANLEYRLMPDARMADLVADVRGGVRAALGAVGAVRALLVGHSAGAHLALAAAHHEPEAVAGAVLLSGIYDLAPIAGSFLQETLRLAPEEVERFSPLRRGWRAGRTLVAVGAEETAFFRDQARTYAAAAGAAHAVFPGQHISVLDGLEAPDGPVSRAIGGLLAGEAWDTDAHRPHPP